MPGDCSLNQNEVSILAPETSFYIHLPKFQDVDSAALMENTGPVRVLFPMAVVGELDRLKESKDRHTRWRADHPSSSEGIPAFRRGGNPILNPAARSAADSLR
ncbi:hypothetical protein ACWD4L_47865, partial [Streptomyces sp. NPDC002596]